MILCEVCHKREAVDPHHIVPKGRTSKKTRAVRAPWCEDRRNKVLLCRECHNKAHTLPGRVCLVHLMAKAYPSWNYNEPPWAEYLAMEPDLDWYSEHRGSEKVTKK